MKTSIIRIGNSRGVRIPKPLLEESEIGETVELVVKKGSITITKLETPNKPRYNEEYLASLPVLRKTWDNSREDEAWKDL